MKWSEIRHDCLTKQQELETPKKLDRDDLKMMIWSQENCFGVWAARDTSAPSYDRNMGRNSYLEEKVQTCSKKRRYRPCEQRVDTRRSTKQLGAKEEGEKEEARCRHSPWLGGIASFQKNYMRIGVRRLLRMGLVFARALITIVTVPH